MQTQIHPLFPFGQVVATPNALEVVTPDEIRVAFQRHLNGDWGELDDEDKTANDEAILVGSRIFSSYETNSQVKFWIITEADRSSTTILLPQDY